MSSSYLIVGAVCLLLFAGAAALASLLTVAALRFAVRFGIMDRPDKRKLHERPVPYLGGVALYLAFVLYNLFLYWRFPDAVESWVWPAFACGGLLVLGGLYDDLKGLSAWAKFPIQIGSALLFYYWTRIGVSGITHPFGGLIKFGTLTPVFTVLWIVLLINAINLIDGLDGLAAGVVAIASFFLFVMELIKGNLEGGLVLLGLSGACVGFLRHNFSPARIFMGDSGSMFLGFMLAIFSVTQSGKGATIVAILFPILILAIPILDTTFAFLRRLSEGKHPFQGDTRHIHHRFLALGLTDSQTVLVIYFFCVALGLFAVVMHKLTPAYRLLTLLLLVMLVSFIILAVRYMESQFLSILAEVKTYKEWLDLAKKENSGPVRTRSACELTSAAVPNSAGEEDKPRKSYRPPSISFAVMDRLLRSEEQRIEQVLVVSEGENAKRLARLIQELGHNVGLVSKEEDLAGKIKETDAGVVLLDETTLGPEVRNLILQVRLTNPGATILVLAGDSEEESNLNLFRLGVYDLLPACAGDDILQVMIHHALESRFLTRRLRLLHLVFWLLVFSIPAWVVLGRFIAAGRLF